MNTNPPLEPVNPALVPYKTFPTGARIPAMGLGTFGSDRFTGGQIAEAVFAAAKLGLRHFDCASVYGNEDAIGSALTRIQMELGIPRHELWITSKLWNDKHGEKDVIESCRKSLRDLQVDFLDLYLVHWPFPNFHPPGCAVSSRSQDAKPYIHGEFLKTWRQMEKLVDLGLVRHIGTSNMTVPKLRHLLPECRIKPVCNEMELHPHFQQKDFVAWLKEHNILPIGFCPIGSPNRPERDRTAEDTCPVEDPVLQEIAQRHGVHPAIICLKWAVQNGQIPIPFSVKPAQCHANLMSTITPPLTDQEMQAIAEIDRNCRLIKGQVFLWKENQTWEDLWDLNGEITPA